MIQNISKAFLSIKYFCEALLEGSDSVEGNKMVPFEENLNLQMKELCAFEML